MSPSTPDQARDQANSLSRPSEYYDQYWLRQADGGTPFLLPSLRKILERNVRPDDVCLDVGCGRGQGAGAWLAENAGSYLGVDVSENALDAARAAGLRVQRIDDASTLPFDDSSFSLAVCIEVFEHLIDPQVAAQEILRVLRPGGRLLATVPNVSYWRRRADMALLGRWNPMGDEQSAHRPWRDPHLRFFSRANLDSMLLEAGFDPVSTGGHGGSWLIDIPGARRLVRARASAPGRVYERLVKLAPSLFAHHLHAIATKPAASA